MTKLHVLGMAFSELTDEWSHCAFSDRTRTFATMMHQAGMDIRLYAGEHNDAEVTEHIPLTTREEQRRWYPDYNARTDVFNSFDSSSLPWATFNARAAEAIRQRAGPGDILCLTMGITHKPVADALADLELFPVETGIGYSGVWAPFRVFESHAWRHYLAARDPTDTVRFYDEVIGRAYPADDFPLGDGSGGYYLFMGRLTERKGPHVAALACERIGAKLLVAGQGDYPLPGDVEYLGVVGPKERADLMGDAIAVFCPSLYLEPFCGVSVESQLCGTPVVASNWGALVENVRVGSGFLCNTLQEFSEAAYFARDLDRPAIRKQALDRWSTGVVAPKFREYFARLGDLYGDGWYA